MDVIIFGGISGFISGMLISVLILGTASGFLGQTGMTFFGIIGACIGAFWGYRMDLKGWTPDDLPIGSLLGGGLAGALVGFAAFKIISVMTKPKSDLSPEEAEQKLAVFGLRFVSLSAVGGAVLGYWFFS